MGVYRSLESWVTRWRLCGLNLRSKKIMLIWDAERPSFTKFQLRNIFCSGELKSQKSRIICEWRWFRIDVVAVHFWSNLISHTNNRQYLGFYFSRTKHVWKLKFGLWGSFCTPNQHDFFRTEIQTIKAPSGDPGFQTFLETCCFGSNRRSFFARHFWSAPIQNLQ